MSDILITGGAGYIGSHACIRFLDAGYNIVVVDNLCNSSEESLNRVKQITGKDVPFIYGDIRDLSVLNAAFEKYNFSAVIHFAGLKAVGESVEKPIEYFDNNIYGTLQLLRSMRQHQVKKIVFSSSATVYGSPASLPIKEDFPRSSTNPYGRSKLMIEEILEDVYVADNNWSIALLRYFNPVGAHKSGMIGEDPFDIPNNLMPYISQVAIGKLSHLNIFGDDYPTVDGTGVRDYIHVEDLAQAHVMALDKLNNNYTGVHPWNLGIGQGSSVLEMVQAFEAVTNKKIPYKITARRPGDIDICYADPSKAYNDLGWAAEKSIGDMMRDTWRWQSNNPQGYRK